MNDILVQRSTISVPANREKMLLKSKSLSADVVMYDLEDSVSFDKKDEARRMLVEFLSQEDVGDMVISYRINEVVSPFAYKDVIYVIENVGDKVMNIVVPKVESREHIVWLDILLTQIEMSLGLDKKISLDISIETAKGMLNVDEIVDASPRIRALVFGIADYSVSLGMFFKGISGHGEGEEFYPGHRFHYPLSKLAVAAKSKNLFAIDAPYGDFRDLDGLKKSCFLSKYLGFDGKWAIHPSQIDVINEVYSPEEEDVLRCKKIVKVYEESMSNGIGTVSIDGRMVDGATYRLARSILDKWERIRS